MKTSIVSAIFATMATLASAAALPVEESSVEATETFDKRAQVFSWWNADDYSGTYGSKTQPGNGVCYNFADKFNDQVSSVGPSKGLHCYLWKDYGCTGQELGKGGGIKYPGIGKLGDFNFNDIASSWKCFYN